MYFYFEIILCQITLFLTFQEQIIKFQLLSSSKTRCLEWSREDSKFLYQIILFQEQIISIIIFFF